MLMIIAVVAGLLWWPICAIGAFTGTNQPQNNGIFSGLGFIGLWCGHVYVGYMIWDVGQIGIFTVYF